MIGIANTCIKYCIRYFIQVELKSSARCKDDTEDHVRKL